MKKADTINDGDLKHMWERMRRGWSATQVAEGRGLTLAEFDRMLWDWRARVAGARSEARRSDFDPRALERRAGWAPRLARVD